jgi:hypothetical protein
MGRPVATLAIIEQLLTRERLPPPIILHSNSARDKASRTAYLWLVTRTYVADVEMRDVAGDHWNIPWTYANP